MSEFGSPPPPKKGMSGRMIVALIILLIAIVFMVQNTASATVNVLWMHPSMPLWLLMVIMFILGMLLGGAVRGGVRKLRGKGKAEAGK